MTAVGSIGEFDLIREIIALAPANLSEFTKVDRSPTTQLVGPGDDAAVIPLGVLGESAKHLVMTSDVLVEGRHFSFELASAEDIGWKILAVSLSDLAAMGAAPVGGTLTVQVPATFCLERLLAVARGLYELGAKTGWQLLGGDTVESNEVSFGVTAIGVLNSAPLLRSGATAGDDIWHSGVIGGGGAGLNYSKLYRASSLEVVDKRAQESIDKFRRPQPRLVLGASLAAKRFASAAIDVSDGLLQDFGHIASMSKVDLEIDLNSVALASGVTESGMSILQACSAGDDYELAFTASPERRSEIEALSVSLGGEGSCRRIGRVVPASAAGKGQVFLKQSDGSYRAASDLGIATGYNHFRAEK